MSGITREEAIDRIRAAFDAWAAEFAVGQDERDQFDAECEAVIAALTAPPPDPGPSQPCCADTLGMPVPCQHPSDALRVAAAATVDAVDSAADYEVTNPVVDAADALRAALEADRG